MDKATALAYFERMSEDSAIQAHGSIAVSARDGDFALLFTGPSGVPGSLFGAVIDDFEDQGFSTQVEALSSGELGIVVS